MVLSSFMGGLTVGAALVARYGSRITRLLRWYAAAEATVAVSGIAITQILPAFTAIAARLSGADGDAWPANAGRFFAGFAILLVPATAMGTTLPLLVASLTRASRAFGPALGWVYGWNTLGAVAGVLGAELILIPRVGVSGSAWCAAVLCSVAAVGGWRLESGGRPAPEVSPVVHQRSTRRISSLLVASFLSGAVLLALEILWFRFLTMFVLSTTLAAAMLLAVVLASIAVGGLIASAWLTLSPMAWR